MTDDFPPSFRGRDRYGDYEVIAADGDYRLVRYDDGREQRRPLATLRLAQRNREFDTGRPPPVAPPPAPPPQPAPPRPRSGKPAAGQPSITFDETLPLIADLIRELAGDPPGYVPDETIAAALLADNRGRRHIARARELQGDDRPPTTIAAGMVAWFSRQFTDRALPYGRDFERRKINGRWAYVIRNQAKAH